MNSATEAQAAIDENIAKGFMEVAGVGPDGEVQYRLTKAGEEHVKRMIQAEQS